MQTSTIHTLPPELVDRILDFMVPKSSYDTPEVEATKEQYSQCALTCYLFASRCQMQLFRQIVLRSEQDLRDLISFITWSDRQWIPEAVQVLLPEYQCGTSRPWIHLITTTLRRKLPRLRAVSLTIKADTAPVSSCPRRIHGLLPRSLPQIITKLALTGGIHFPNLLDLFRLLNSLPTLERLTCADVTWGAAPDSLPRLRTSHGLARVEALACTDWWPLLWTVLAPKSVPTPPGWPYSAWTPLAPEELAVVREIVSELVAGISAARWSVVFDGWDIPGTEIPFTSFEVSFYSYDNGHRDRRAAPSMHTPFDKRGAVQRINGIEFDFDVRGLVLEDALRCDWPRIGRLVEALACIQRIAFGASSVEDYERFLQEKGSAFEHLGKQMVRYAVSRKCAAPDDGFWEWTGQGEFKDRVMGHLLA